MYTTTSISIKNYYKFTKYTTYYRQWFNTCTKDTAFFNSLMNTEVVQKRFTMVLNTTKLPLIRTLKGNEKQVDYKLI